MKFDLLLTDFRRARWLLWGLLTDVGVLLGLLALHSRLAFWAFVALPALLWAALIFMNQLFRRPGWVQVNDTGLEWDSPNEAAPRSVTFAELATYRFVPSRNGVGLRLRLRNGELVHFGGHFDDSFAAFWKALDQAVRRYNQAHPGAEIKREKDGFEKFFEHPASTRVLWGLLVLSAAWVARCLSCGAGGLAYLPLLLLLPYLAIWANYYYERR